MNLDGNCTFKLTNTGTKNHYIVPKATDTKKNLKKNYQNNNK